jgi:hypothetical protein
VTDTYQDPELTVRLGAVLESCQRADDFDRARGVAKFDTWREDEPRCPHCGYVMTDAGELFGGGFENDGDDTEVECGRCEREYEVTLHVSYTYTTKRTPQP